MNIGGALTLCHGAGPLPAYGSSAVWAVRAAAQAALLVPAVRGVHVCRGPQLPPPRWAGPVQAPCHCLWSVSHFNWMLLSCCALQ